MEKHKFVDCKRAHKDKCHSECKFSPHKSVTCCHPGEIQDRNPFGPTASHHFLVCHCEIEYAFSVGANWFSFPYLRQVSRTREEGNGKDQGKTRRNGPKHAHGIRKKPQEKKNWAALRSPAKSLTVSGLNGNYHQTLKDAKKLRNRMAGSHQE